MFGWLFRGIANKVVDKVFESGSEFRQKAFDRVLDVGERELLKGAKDIGKIVQDEMKKNNPERVATEVTKLAQENKGEVTVAQVMARLEVNRQMAYKVLENLAARKVCYSKYQHNEKFYIFSGFQEKREVKICEYCDGVFNVDEVGDECPSCGAILTVSKKIIE